MDWKFKKKLGTYILYICFETEPEPVSNAYQP